MLKRLIYILLLPFIVTSCVYQVDHLRGEDEEGLLNVQVLAGLKDTTVIYLSSTVPMSSIDDIRSAVVPVKDARVDVTVDGKPVRIIELESDIAHSEREKFFLIPDRISQGARIELQAQCPGLDPVSAGTTLPFLPPEFEVEAELISMNLEDFLEYDDKNSGYRSSGSGAVRFSLTFKDDPETEDYYGVRLFKHNPANGISMSGFLLKSDNFLSVYETERLYLFTLYDVFSRSVSGLYSDRCMTCFSDVEFNGQEVTKEYMMQHIPKYYDHYNIQLFRLSEEMYRAAESVWFLHMNDLAYFGQATLFPYTNVAGGTGCLGAATMRETGFFKVGE